MTKCVMCGKWKFSKKIPLKCSNGKTYVAHKKCLKPSKIDYKRTEWFNHEHKIQHIVFNDIWYINEDGKGWSVLSHD